MKDIIIYGFGGFATGDVVWLIDEINEAEEKWNIIGYLDDDATNHGKTKNGYSVLGGADWLDKYQGELYCAVAIGSGKIREKIVDRIKGKVKGFPALIHPLARISRYSIVGNGAIICAGCLVAGNVTVGDYAIVNLDCTLGHDAVLHEFSIVSPGAHISGNVEIGRYADIGTGAVIIQGIKIGEGSIIGAAAAVVKDIPSDCTAVGVPAKIIGR